MIFHFQIVNFQLHLSIVGQYFTSNVLIVCVSHIVDSVITLMIVVTIQMNPIVLGDVILEGMLTTIINNYHSFLYSKNIQLNIILEDRSDVKKILLLY